MNIGIRLHDAAGKDMVQKFDNAKAQGFTCVHLALSKLMGSEYAQPDFLTQDLAEQVKKQVAPMDLTLLGCYLNLAHPDRHAADAITQQYIAHLQFSKWVGAMMVGTETGNPSPEYRYDPVHSHSEKSLALLIERMEPLVQAAQDLNVLIAIEPVWSHIVCNAKRARQVLDHFNSPHLKIILDPANLLNVDLLDHYQQVFDEAYDLLIADTALLHIKDLVLEDGDLKALAAGHGMLDYRPLFTRLRGDGLSLPITLENTQPHNAVAARQFVFDLYNK